MLNMERRLVLPRHDGLAIRTLDLGDTDKVHPVVLEVNLDLLNDGSEFRRVLEATLVGDTGEGLEVVGGLDVKDFEGPGADDGTEVFGGVAGFLDFHVPELGVCVGEGLIDSVVFGNGLIDVVVGECDGSV